MKKILCVASSGGHLSELEQINLDYAKKILVSEKTPTTINQKIDYYLKYGSRKNKVTYGMIFFSNLYYAIKIIIKENPDIVLSTGAHSCVPFFYIAKLFRKKTIYIESYARVKSKSLTYRLIKNQCDYVIVQQKELVKIYENSIYLGSVY